MNSLQKKISSDMIVMGRSKTDGRLRLVSMLSIAEVQLGHHWPFPTLFFLASGAPWKSDHILIETERGTSFLCTSRGLFPFKFSII